MFPLADTVRSRTFPVVNWLIILTNVLVFALFELGRSEQELLRLFTAYGLVPVTLFAGEPWALLTLLTSQFLHGGWVHLISNLWALYIFGDNVEDRLGSGRYLFFYLVCGVVAGLVQSYLTAGSRLPLIGASGAIAGVLAAYLLAYPTARVITLIPIFILPWFVEIPAVLYLIIWFVSQLFSGVMALGQNAAEFGGVAYWAHIGGFAAGLLLALLFAPRPSRRPQWYPDEYQPW
jgi:membrane associated rhomboid family serine protease